MSSSQIIYLAIARGTSILASYTKSSGNFSQFSQNVLEKVDEGGRHTIFNYDRHIFATWKTNGVTYLAMAEKGYSERIIKECLLDIKNIFVKQFSDEVIKNAIDLAFEEPMKKDLQQKMMFYNDPNNDKIQGLKNNTEDTMNVIHQNLEKLIDRGQKLEVIAERSKLMHETSISLKSNARDVRNQMWWKNVKVYVFIVILVLVLIYVIMMLSCGGPALQGCFGQDSGNNTPSSSSETPSSTTSSTASTTSAVLSQQFLDKLLDSQSGY